MLLPTFVAFVGSICLNHWLRYNFIIGFKIYIKIHFSMSFNLLSYKLQNHAHVLGPYSYLHWDWYGNFQIILNCRHIGWQESRMLLIIITLNQSIFSFNLKLMLISDPKPLSGAGYQMLLPWLGEGLVITKGKKWARNRRLLTPAFHFEILRPYMRIYHEATKVLLVSWVFHFSPCPYSWSWWCNKDDYHFLLGNIK